jgi:hypothetical protein
MVSHPGNSAVEHISDAEQEVSNAASMLLCTQEGNVMTWACQEWQLRGSGNSQHTRGASDCCGLTSHTELNRRVMHQSNDNTDIGDYQDLCPVVPIKAVRRQQELRSIAQNIGWVLEGIPLKGGLQQGPQSHGDNR